MKRLSVVTTIVFIWVAFSGIASAGLIFIPTTYGMSARSVGMGNAMTAVGGDFSTAFYNPAALGKLETNQIDFSYLYAAPNLKGGPENDSSAESFDSANKLTIIGFTMNLSTLLKKPHGLGLGFDIMVDNNMKSFMEFDDVRNDNGQFIRYGLSSVTMAVGVGAEIIPQLYVGGGGFIMIKGKNKLIAQTDMGGNTQEEQIQVSAEPAIAPMFSIFAPIHDMVTLGAIYRGKGQAEFSSINASTEALVSESPLTDLNLLMAFKDTYVPQQAALGVSVRPVEQLLIAVDTTWANWGDYDDEISKGDVVKEDGKFTTKDTYTPRIGFEYKPVSTAALRLGYFYEQTPFVKPGSGNVVFLDNDKHGISLGASHDITYIPAMRYPVTIGAAYFFHHLVTRTVDTDDGLKYKSSGDIQGVIGSLTFRF
jgi:long-subunit fatty acid transport protein